MSAPTPTRRPDDRGQAFTLEGFIASIVILTAILFALQAIVITPSTSGSVDQEVREQLKTEARDILTASANNGSEDLSAHIRFFSNETKGTWVGDSTTLSRGYGSEEPLSPRKTILGTALNQTFTQNGFTYNVQLEYLSATASNETETIPMVFRGVPTEESVSITYTVVLYDNQTLTASADPNCDTRRIEEINPRGTNWNNTGSSVCFFPIPEAELFDDDDNTGGDDEAGETSDSPIYNIVEVRVVIWG